MKPQFARHVYTVGLFVFLVTGCGSPSFREANLLVAEGNLEAALPKLRAATEEAPNNPEYRAAYDY